MESKSDECFALENSLGVPLWGGEIIKSVVCTRVLPYNIWEGNAPWKIKVELKSPSLQGFRGPEAKGRCSNLYCTSKVIATEL